MHHEHCRLLEKHFHAALSLPEARRTVYLDRVRRTDPPLHGDLERLLEVSRAASRFLEDAAPRARAAADPAGTLQPGARLAHWRIVRLVGSGGMGEVYEVRRVQGGRVRRAALKLASALADRSRSRAEQRILAGLRHQGVPRLLDAGESSAGPYLVMELVEGVAITRHCETRGAGLRERLALFLQLCEIVAHLHRRSIAHGDIKPGHALVGADGRVRLVDFGSAVALRAGGGQPPAAYLTPDYAAPEQLTGAPASAETDVHALGIVLYELLVGRRPWIGTGGLTFRALHDLLIGAAPRASEAAARPPAAASASSRSLRGPLDSIIATCLRREPGRRYGSAAALARDVAAAIAAVTAGRAPSRTRRARAPLPATHAPRGASYRLPFRPRGRSGAPPGEGRRRAK